MSVRDDTMGLGQASTVADTSLPSGTVMSYGMVAGPFEMLRAPALAILPALYTKEYGLSLTTVSLALLLLRLSDGVSDFAIGLLSDRTHSRWGPRKPWLFGSIFLALPAAYGLFVPGERASIWSFSACYFFFYLAWAMFEIPYTAWSTELARSYEDRSRLALSRGLWSNLGLIVLSLVPLLPFLPSSEMNFQTLHVMFWVVAIAYPLGIIYAVVRVPAGKVVESSTPSSLLESVRAVRGNGPLIRFLVVAFLSDLGVGVMGSLFFLFFDTYLKIGASFSLIFLTAIAASTVSLKFWEYLVRRTSKRSLLVTGLAGATLQGLLVYVLNPGPYALPMFVVYMSFFYALAVGRDMALFSIIGDIVDFDTLKTGGNRSGQFTSVWMVLRKFAYAVAPASAFFIAGAAGYDPASGSNNPTAIFGLKAANGYIPALFMLIATLLAIKFPISADRHRIISRRLEQRALRAGTEHRVELR